MKVLSSKIHGVIDYVFDLVFLAAPALFGLSSTAAAICYTIAAAHFLTSLCTKYELGLFKLIPFPVHGGLEFAAAFALLLIPWIAGVGEEVAARNFFMAAGAALFGVWLTTDYGHANRVAVTDTMETYDEETWRKAS